MSAALKLFLTLLSDEKSRKKIFLIVGSIIAGLIGMLLLVFVVLAELNQLDPPKIQLNEAEIQPIFIMESKSKVGFQSHSARAQLSSIRSGQESAMA